MHVEGLTRLGDEHTVRDELPHQAVALADSRKHVLVPLVVIRYVNVELLRAFLYLLIRSRFLVPYSNG